MAVDRFGLSRRPGMEISFGTSWKAAAGSRIQTSAKSGPETEVHTSREATCLGLSPLLGECLSSELTGAWDSSGDADVVAGEVLPK